MTAEQIRLLNDQLRQTFTGGKVGMSAGVTTLPDDVRAVILEKVREFAEFNEGNDPHAEHDFGAFELNGAQFFWKIDYYDERIKWGSDDPSDPTKTTRVLSIMLSDEY